MNDPYERIYYDDGTFEDVPRLYPHDDQEDE